MGTYYQANACRCAACRSRALLGPTLLIILGVLLMLQMTSWRFPLHDTWPVLLIVIGAVKLFERIVPAPDHRDVTTLTPPTPAHQTGPGR